MTKDKGVSVQLDIVILTLIPDQTVISSYERGNHDYKGKKNL